MHNNPQRHGRLQLAWPIASSHIRLRRPCRFLFQAPCPATPRELGGSGGGDWAAGLDLALIIHYREDGRLGGLDAVLANDGVMQGEGGEERERIVCGWILDGEREHELHVVMMD